MEKKISIVTPIHNSESTLAECLDNIFAVDYKNFEVIIVDDCSTDRSVEIAKRYPCKLIILPEGRGPAFARDKGISFADGEIVAFLDSDCIPPKDWLKKIDKKLTPDIIGIGGKYEIPGDINIISKLFMAYWYLKDIIYTKPSRLISLYGGNSAFWKSALMHKREKKELLYCNRTIGSDDTLMCRELMKAGKVIYDRDISILHKQKATLINIFKKSISYGYSGAKTVGLCGSLLFREPHHIYKSILYMLSISLLFLTFMLPFLPIWKVYLSFLMGYIIVQLPIMLLAYKHSLRSPYVSLLPAAIFSVSILNLIGHIKATLHTVKSGIKSFAWYIKLIFNVLNPFALSRIFFFVTKKCNANCYFCFNKREAQEGNSNENLSLKEIKKIADNIGFLPWLTITGGEPFLRPDIYEICKIFYDKTHTRFINIVTNGILTSYIKDTLEKLLIDCDCLHLVIVIALDNTEEKHDYLKGINGCYKNALSTLEELNTLKSRYSRLTLDVNTMLTKENSGRIEYILDYFSNNLIYDRQYLNLLRQPACTSIETELISIEKYLKILKKTNEKLRRRSNSIKGRFAQALLEYCCAKSLKEFMLKKPLSACLASQRFLVIDNNSDILACELLPEKLGNLRDVEYKLKKIIKSQELKKTRSKIIDGGCYCQWPCAAATNVIFKISSYPGIINRIVQSYFRKMERSL